MERRVLLAVALSVLVLLGWSALIEHVYGPPPGTRGRTEAPRPSKATPQAPAGGTTPATARQGEAAAPAGSAAARPVAPHGRDIVVETPLYRAVITTGGGRLRSFRLLRYRTSVDRGSPPLELIPPGPPDSLPLGVVLRGPAPDPAGGVRTRSDAEVSYAAEGQRLVVGEGEEARLVLRGALAGATIEKVLRFRGDTYLVTGKVRLDRIPQGFSEVDLEWNLPRAGGGGPGAEIVFDAFLALQDRKLRRQPMGKLEEGEVVAGPIRWAAYTGKYFLAALVPESDAVRLWRIRREDRLESLLLLPPGAVEASFDVYLGPKEMGILKKAGHDLYRAIDLGWFTFVALPLLRALQLSHSLTGNYGIDIILLTILIKIAFYPLTKKSYESMRAMQKLQPQMQRIREEFKDDPQRMNKEVMELYRRHRVNPLGGCLPMLLQMPIFIGLYQALLNAVELRHAPFVLWINDLSAPDRLGSLHIPFVEPPGVPVLTILMGLSMLAMQWMTPSSADPTQQRVMLLMPVVFTVMFVNFPSGLTLYWLVNNVLTIGQQYYILRKQRA